MAAYDLFVVGGGINGAGIARDAAGRGLSVMLCEQDDLASHTSSASTKLIHGGLRYLEYREFGLVRKALQEREVLLRAAPHIIGPMRFVMPHDEGQRPAWMIRAGLFLYDHLAVRERLPGSCGVDLRRHPAGHALQPAFVRGFEYSDAWVQDARLVVLNAMDAHERGARIATRASLVAARRDDEAWSLTLQNQHGGREAVSARMLVNAAGPWVSSLLHGVLRVGSAKAVRLVKGSHIVVRRRFEHPYAYIFQNPDRRIIFAIPFERDYCLIGTTDLDYRGDPAKVAIEPDEVSYLCRMANRYFREPIRPDEVAWQFSGVRPLLDDDAGEAASVTRDYALELDTARAPLLSVFGGKLTTYRKLAEEVMEAVASQLGNSAPPWTADAPLPGGDLPGADIDAFVQRQLLRWPRLPPALIERYARTYGSRMEALLDGVADTADLGDEIIPGLFGSEARYLMREEFALTAEDILWRRTKLGLGAADEEVGALQRWIERHRAGLGD
ncbi:glycerol-3-phosphate dehydrogenase [Niveibacterium sp.]|uniref:glycerol-3-phosphate dehydrogenase n=1 Tax=Niveibacterium sp. TaxID=2017444 RepID=UPI0035B04F56